MFNFLISSTPSGSSWPWRGSRSNNGGYFTFSCWHLEYLISLYCSDRYLIAWNKEPIAVWDYDISWIIIFWNGENRVQTKVSTEELTTIINCRDSVIIILSELLLVYHLIKVERLDLSPLIITLYVWFGGELKTTWYIRCSLIRYHGNPRK